MRSLKLVPIIRSPSNSCTSMGEVTDTHPETGAPSAAPSGTTSDAVVPASTVTTCLHGAEIALQKHGMLTRREIAHERR